MIANLSNLLTKQEITSAEDLASFRLLRATVLASLAGALGTLVAVIYFGSSNQARFIIITLTSLLAVSLALLERRVLLPARIMAPVSLYATITFLLISGNGLHDIALIGYGGVMIVASLTLGKRGTYVAAGLIILAIFSIASAEIRGLLITDASALTTSDDPFLITMVVVSIALIQNALIERMNIGLLEARTNAQAQLELNRQLSDLKNSLEVIVRARTAELEQANEINAHRAAQFESVARVARATTNLEFPSALLPSTAGQIARLFGYDRVAIHLLNEGLGETSQIGVFDQTNGETSSLIQDYVLNTDTLAGVVAANGLSRLALNEDADRVYFATEALAPLKSEIALPLITGARVIGVLDVFSRSDRAFATEDISVLTLLADVLSNALEGSKQFLFSRNTVLENASAYQESLGQTWERYIRDESLHGFRFAGGISTPVLPEAGGSNGTDQSSVRPASHEIDNKTRIVTPVNLRGQTIGNLEILMPEGQAWSEDDLDIVETVAERLAFSIENARLFQSSAGRAERERIVSEIAAKISGSVRVESILRTTAQELSQALSGAEVLIQLKPGEPQEDPE